MLTVISLTNVQHIISTEQIALCGMLVAISMILSMSIAEILSESNLWNGWAASTHDMHDAPLLLVFVAIVVYKILLIL